MNVSPSEGGCWYCRRTDGLLAFCCEFDCFLHVECVADAERADRDNLHAQETQIIASEILGDAELVRDSIAVKKFLAAFYGHETTGEGAAIRIVGELPDCEHVAPDGLLSMARIVVKNNAIVIVPLQQATQTQPAQPAPLGYGESRGRDWANLARGEAPDDL
jgi:hypothetical protein